MGKCAKTLYVCISKFIYFPIFHSFVRRFLLGALYVMNEHKIARLGLFCAELFFLLLRFNLFRFGQTSAFHSFNHNSMSSSTYRTWFSLSRVLFRLFASRSVYTVYWGTQKNQMKKKRRPIHLLCIYILGEHCVMSPLSPMCICLYFYIAIHFLCDIDNLLCMRMAKAMV